MTSQTAKAVDLVTRFGLRVFALVPRGGVPLRKGWQAEATNDILGAIEVIQGDCNIGVLTSGLVVLDLDEKPDKDGVKQNGIAEFEAMAAELGLPRHTLTVRTPSGGKHVYYASPDRMFANSVKKLSPSIDVRAEGGLCVGPGSITRRGEYVIEIDAPIAPLPDNLAERLATLRRKAAQAGEVVGEVDTVTNIEHARQVASVAPGAVEGARNITLYKLATRLGDCGVGPEVCLEFCFDWAERTGTEFDGGDDEIEKTVASSYASRQTPVGRDNFDHVFGVIETAGVPRAVFGRPYLGTNESNKLLPPRPWLVLNKLLDRKVTVLAAEGAAGKSLYSIQLAIAIITGRTDIITATPVVGLLRRKVKILLVNNEDGYEEMEMRIAAVCALFAVDPATLHGHLFLFSGEETKFRAIVRNGRKGDIVRGEQWAEMVRFVTEEQIGLTIFDPLVSMHTGLNENDNSEMQIVMDAMTSLAAQTGAAGLVVHHSNKPSNGGGDRAGNVATVRGAKAITDAARTALTMSLMTAKEAEAYGVAPRERRRYVRMDDAKYNLYMSDGAPEWFRKESVQLDNGEWMGVLKPVVLRRAADDAGPPVLEFLASRLAEPMSVSAAAKLVLSSGAFGAVSASTVQRKITSAFSAGDVIAVGGVILTLDRRGEQGGVISASKMAS